MGSSDRLFNRQRSLHQILGGGLIADVVLWRTEHLTMGILVVTVFSWLVFERSGYTLLSLVSNVFLLLFAILFFWAKSAAILNRPAPPLPHFYLSEEVVDQAAAFIRGHLNKILSVSEDIALGKDSGMFMRVIAGLSVASIVGSLTDFLTLCYSGFVIVLTVPKAYEIYEDYVDRYLLLAYREVQQFYLKLDSKCMRKVRSWILEKKKKL